MVAISVSVTGLHVLCVMCTSELNCLECEWKKKCCTFSMLVHKHYVRAVQVTQSNGMSVT